MKKLLQFKIADGLENRTIVSGIAQHYKPEELVGKQVLFIANLAPRVHRQPGSPPVQERSGERRHDSQCRRLGRLAGCDIGVARGEAGQ